MTAYDAILVLDDLRLPVRASIDDWQAFSPELAADSGPGLSETRATITYTDSDAIQPVLEACEAQRALPLEVDGRTLPVVLKSAGKPHQRIDIEYGGGDGR